MSLKKSIVFILVLALVALAFYFALIKDASAPNIAPANSPDATIPSGWATDTNDARDFSIAYPDQLTPTTSFQSYYHLSWAWRSGASGDQSTGTRLLAIPVYRVTQNNAYPRYYDAEIRIGESANPYDVAHCMDNNQTGRGTATTSAVINGIPFTVFQLADAGMMQYLKGVSYRTIHNGACWAIEQLSAGSSYRDDPPSPNDISDTTLDAYYNGMLPIIETFRFIH